MKVNSLKSSRIRTDHVNRNNPSSNVARVAPLAPVQATENPTGYASDNYLMAYDDYAEKLADLKREFKSYFKSEAKVKLALVHLDEDPQEMARNMQVLINKYNQAISSLAALEGQQSPSPLPAIELVLDKYANWLQAFGIANTEGVYLTFDQQAFLQKLHHHSRQPAQVFAPIKGIIVELYLILTGFLSNGKKKANQYAAAGVEVKGLLIDDLS